MKLHFAVLFWIVLLLGCSRQQQHAQKVYDSIARIEHSGSTLDYEARLRDAEKDLDESKDSLSVEMYTALISYKSSVTQFRGQLEHQDYMLTQGRGLPTYAQIVDTVRKQTARDGDLLQACRDDAYRAVNGKDPISSKTKDGDCRRLENLKMDELRKETAKTN